MQFTANAVSRIQRFNTQMNQAMLHYGFARAAASAVTEYNYWYSTYHKGMVMRETYIGPPQHPQVTRCET